MRALIVDDEPLACSRLTRLCQQRSDLEIVAQADSGSAAIDAIRALRPDLVLLDVELQDMTGFDVLRSLDPHEEPFAIMVTAHAEYALRAFETEAIDYLTKPVDAVRLDDAIERARRRLSQASGTGFARQIAAQVCAQLGGHTADAAGTASDDTRLVGEKNRRFYFLDAQTVDYVEADGNYVLIHVGEDRYISRNTLKHLGGILQPRGFIRIERSLLLNLRRVAYAERLGEGEFAFTLRSGARLVSSKAHHRTILQELRRGTRSG